MTGDLVGASGFAGIPTSAIDPPLRRLLQRSRRFSGPGPHHVDHIQHFSQTEFGLLYAQDELYMKFLWITYAQPRPSAMISIPPSSRVQCDLQHRDLGIPVGV